MGNTLQLLVGLFVHIEADDMGHKINPLFFQLFCCSTGVRVTGLFPVRDENDRRFLFGILDLISHFSQRTADRCFPFGFNVHHRTYDIVLVNFTYGYDRLNVVTVPFFSVSVNRQPQLNSRVPLLDHIFQRISGNLYFGFTVYLPPHTPRCIKDDDCTRIIFCY